MGVSESRAVVGLISLITVCFGAHLPSRTALDPCPLEGRMELLLSWPQYSSLLQACCVPWCPSVFLGKGLGAEWCV